MQNKPRALKLIGGAAVGQVISLAAYPVLTRLFSPGELGVLSVYTSVLGTLAVVACLRYEQAIPLPKEDDDATALLFLSVLFAFVVALATGFAMWLYPSALSSVGGQANLPDVLATLLPIGVFLLAVYQALSMMALRLGNYGRLGVTRATQSFAAAVVQVTGGILGGGPSLLILGHIVGQSSGLSSLALLAVRSKAVRMPAIPRIVRVARRYKKFTYIGMPAALLNTAALLLPSILIAYSYGLPAAGHFSLAVLVLSAPVQLIGRSVAQVFFAESSKKIYENPQSVRLMLQSTSKKLSVWSIVPAVALIFLGPWVFGIFFGEGWEFSGQLASILTVAYLLSLVASPASQVFLVVERQDISLILNILKLIVSVVSFSVLPIFKLDIIVSVISYGIGMSLYYASVIFISFVILGRRSESC